MIPVLAVDASSVIWCGTWLPCPIVAALVACDQVGCKVDVRELPSRVKVKVGPLERDESMRGAIIKGDLMPVGLI